MADSKYKCENHKLDIACLGCIKAWIARHDRMLEFVKSSLEHTCYLCKSDCCIPCNVKELLKQIGELE